MDNAQRNLITVMLLYTASALPNAASAAAVNGQGTWESTLQGRDLDGDLSTFEAYYDTTLDITWLADANYASTSGYNSNGLMDWTAAMTWVAELNPYNSGITGWRLPTATDIGPVGCNGAYPNGGDCFYNVDPSSGEMAHMYYVTLGDLAYFSTAGTAPQAGWGLTNTGPFSNIQRDAAYWTETGYPYYPDRAYTFWFDDGYQVGGGMIYERYAWAVHAGDISAITAVPTPTALWLFGSGLLALTRIARKR